MIIQINPDWRIRSDPYNWIIEAWRIDYNTSRPHSALVLLQFSGELFAHSRSAISNWTGLW